MTMRMHPFYQRLRLRGVLELRSYVVRLRPLGRRMLRRNC